MKKFACFDVGGTFIKYGVVNEAGELLCDSKFPTPEDDCGELIPKLIAEKTGELKAGYALSGVGISTAGQVDHDKGVIIFATDNLPKYTGTKLAELVRNMTGLECRVENDVNAAALGEMWKGAAKGVKTFVCMTLGTGIGGAIIIDGKLLRGVGGSAGELGHMITNFEGEPCTCGMKGCFERYSSTLALVRSYVSRKRAAGEDISGISGEEVMERVRAGEYIANEVYDRFLDQVVAGIASLTHILDPGLFIIGGGLSNEGKPFFDEINRRLQNAIMPSFAKHTRVVQAELKNKAGLLGACYSIMNGI
ncbi:ROK family protein [Pseudoclostridium thermosuccinogenes]|uniref:ROK family protein n=1 Tax=Clostridium thermosuccinogenes TaxID=84032 RepID=UPI0013747C59|nr:ROK family protein [Pseudoclostridium thermosuccinogenes]